MESDSDLQAYLNQLSKKAHDLQEEDASSSLLTPSRISSFEAKKTKKGNYSNVKNQEGKDIQSIKLKELEEKYLKKSKKYVQDKYSLSLSISDTISKTEEIISESNLQFENVSYDSEGSGSSYSESKVNVKEVITLNQIYQSKSESKGKDQINSSLSENVNTISNLQTSSKSIEKSLLNKENYNTDRKSIFHASKEPKSQINLPSGSMLINNGSNTLFYSSSVSAKKQRSSSSSHSEINSSSSNNFSKEISHSSKHHGTSKSYSNDTAESIYTETSESPSTASKKSKNEESNSNSSGNSNQSNIDSVASNLSYSEINSSSGTSSQSSKQNETLKSYNSSGAEFVYTEPSESSDSENKETKVTISESSPLSKSKPTYGETVDSSKKNISEERFVKSSKTKYNKPVKGTKENKRVVYKELPKSSKRKSRRNHLPTTTQLDDLCSYQSGDIKTKVKKKKRPKTKHFNSKAKALSSSSSSSISSSSSSSSLFSVKIKSKKLKKKKVKLKREKSLTELLMKTLVKNLPMLLREALGSRSSNFESARADPARLVCCRCGGEDFFKDDSKARIDAALKQTVELTRQFLDTHKTFVETHYENINSYYHYTTLNPNYSVGS